MEELTPISAARVKGWKNRRRRPVSPAWQLITPEATEDGRHFAAPVAFMPTLQPET